MSRRLNPKTALIVAAILRGTVDRPALTGPALMSVTQRSESRLFSSLSSNAPPSSQVRVAYSPVRYAA